MKKREWARFFLGLTLWAILELAGLGPYTLLMAGEAPAMFPFGAYLSIYFFACGMSMFPPASLLYMLCGERMGFWAGAAVAIIGSAFCFAAAYSRGCRGKTTAVSELISVVGAGGFLTAFVLRAMRLLPSEYVGINIGRARLSFWGYMLGSLAGTMPSIMLYLSLGEALSKRLFY